MKIRSVCVYCGSSPGVLPEYVATARAFGQMLASKGLVAVYGGGNVGLMGAMADGALSSGGHVIGVIPQMLAQHGLAHAGLTKLHTVSTMHERKAKMAQLSDAFVALPGGIGTFEEIFEAMTWAQLGIHKNPCAFLNTADFYSPLVEFLRHAVNQRFFKAEQFETLIVEKDMTVLLARMESYKPNTVEKWLDRGVH